MNNVCIRAQYHQLIRGEHKFHQMKNMCQLFFANFRHRNPTHFMNNANIAQKNPESHYWLSGFFKA
jgi:hypothetical protein